MNRLQKLKLPYKISIGAIILIMVFFGSYSYLRYRKNIAICSSLISYDENKRAYRDMNLEYYRTKQEGIDRCMNIMNNPTIID